MKEEKEAQTTPAEPRQGEKIGYRRVSTTDQNTDRQLDGVEVSVMFEEKASGKDRNRPELEKCLFFLRPGDTLIVHSIDRLARDLRDLQDIVTQITDKGAGVEFLKEQLRFSPGAGDSVSKLLLQIMGAFAEFERSMIKERQREGIDQALKKGVRFGRETVLTPEIAEAIEKGLKLGLPKSQIAGDCGISRQTIYNYLNSK